MVVLHVTCLRGSVKFMHDVQAGVILSCLQWLVVWLQQVCASACGSGGPKLESVCSEQGLHTKSPVHSSIGSLDSDVWDYSSDHML